MPATQAVKVELQRLDNQRGKDARTYDEFGPAVPRGKVRKNFRVQPEVISDPKGFQLTTPNPLV